MRPRPPLELLVFVVGIATLGSEIAVARLIAPFFGDSTIVWANTIAVVLVALSIGYWFGGRLADRHPHLPGLCGLVLASSVLLAVVPIVAQPLLSLSVDAFDDVSIGGFAGSLFGVLALVSIPVLMLGAVSPWAIRLKLERVEDSGETAGRMYAISTVGSLVGTFSASLLLIPLLGTQRTFLVYAILLALVAALGLGRRWMLAPLAVAALLLLPVGVVKAAEEGRVIHEAETTYQYARVIEYPDGRRQLELNEGQAIHSIWRRDTVLTGNYWDGHLTLPFTLHDTPPRKVAMLGVAGGTVARAYAKYFPDTVIDAVEIDGELFDIGEKYFGLEPRPQLRLHTDDARPFLRKTDERYDFIFLDTYRQPYIPFYLATKEFFELARDRLAPGGAVIINVGHPEGSSQLERVLTATMGAAFPYVTRDPVRDTNTLLIGSTTRPSAERLRNAALGHAARARPGGADRRAAAGPRAAGRRRLHRRPRAGRVARRQVAARLRGGERAVITTGPLGPGDLDAVLAVWVRLRGARRRSGGGLARRPRRDDRAAELRLRPRQLRHPRGRRARRVRRADRDAADVRVRPPGRARPRARDVAARLGGGRRAGDRRAGLHAVAVGAGCGCAGAARRARLRAALGGLVLRAGPRRRARRRPRSRPATRSGRSAPATSGSPTT